LALEVFLLVWRPVNQKNENRLEPPGLRPGQGA
jgi:hypothetical protein